MQISCKNKTRLGHNFHFKFWIPKDLTSSAVYKIQCRFYNEFYYDECVRHSNIKISQQYIGI